LVSQDIDRFRLGLLPITGSVPPANGQFISGKNSDSLNLLMTSIDLTKTSKTTGKLSVLTITKLPGFSRRDTTELQ